MFYYCTYNLCMCNEFFVADWKLEDVPSYIKDKGDEPDQSVANMACQEKTSAAAATNTVLLPVSEKFLCDNS